MSTRVYLTVRQTGIAFGCIGQIRSSKTGRVLREVAHPRPYGHTAMAIQDARVLAERHGYYVEIERTSWRHD